MGLDAEVLAIGPYSKGIVSALEYPSHFYQSTHDGSTIITNVFTAVTSEQSHFLANCFGIDAWDFDRHELNPFDANIEKLLDSDFAEDVSNFLSLRDAGFKFYYLPNG